MRFRIKYSLNAQPQLLPLLEGRTLQASPPMDFVNTLRLML